MNAMQKACKALSLSQTYAEDGAVMSAIEYATEGLALLFVERDRRMKIGMVTPSNAHGAIPELQKIVAKGAREFKAEAKKRRAAR